MPEQPPFHSNQLRASSSTDLVEQLRSLSALRDTDSLEQFMEQVATQFRVHTHGLIVRTDTTDHFIADLMQHGWIRVKSD